MTADDTSSLDKAIALYIDGDLQQAEALFAELTQQPRSREDLEVAYLYLGRIYLAQENYQEAAEAFSAGRTLGGDVRFDEYFEEAARNLNASRDRINRRSTITRAQLAALIDDLFGLGAVGNPNNMAPRGSAVASTSIEEERHWARGHIAVVCSTGVMAVLPDGAFHPDETVTRSAFYVTVYRLIDWLGLSGAVMDELFHGGYRGTVESSTTAVGSESDKLFVTGRDAVETLDRLARLAGQ